MKGVGRTVEELTAEINTSLPTHTSATQLANISTIMYSCPSLPRRTGQPSQRPAQLDDQVILVLPLVPAYDGLVLHLVRPGHHVLYPVRVVLADQIREGSIRGGQSSFWCCWSAEILPRLLSFASKARTASIPASAWCFTSASPRSRRCMWPPSRGWSSGSKKLKPSVKYAMTIII